MKVLLALSLAIVSVACQDDFRCPDEFEGFYPHLYSCDKYWECSNGRAELKLCGNGLGFSDLDPTFTTENCDYIYNVDCGNRTEVEPPIQAPNCPRLYGTFPDQSDCTGFYNCRNGVSNRYACAPGLAYDPNDRVCKWADEVPACKAQDSQDGVVSASSFLCPTESNIGTFSKHAHPEDCRQYFVCISGIAREYGCPLGTVFKEGNDDYDGKCSDPADVPECVNYYGDLNFDKQELVKAGVDPEAVGAGIQEGRTRVNRPRPARPQPPPQQQQKSARPQQPPQQPKPSFNDIPTVQSPSRPTRVRPNRPVQARPTSAFAAIPQQPAFRAPPTRPRPVPTTPTPVSPSPTTTSSAKEVKGDKQPAKIKAGEDYNYYYYYYYDDEEETPDST